MKYAIKGIKLIDGGSMASNLASAIQNSSVGDSSVSFLDNIGFQFIWTGNPTGTISVQASIDGSTWNTLVLSPAITQPAGTASSDIANINQFPFKWIRVIYTRSSGTGSLTVWMAAKEI